MRLGRVEVGPVARGEYVATEANLTLGQVAVDGKSNEITAIPPLLELLDLHRAMVEHRRHGLSKRNRQENRRWRRGLSATVKGNQEHLLEDVQATLEKKRITGELPAQAVLQHSTTEQGHGRQEKRSYVVVQDVKGIRDHQAWPKLKTVGMCCSERTVKGKTTTEVRYFIGSRSMGVRQYAKVWRGH